jgi:hypothetical protein
VNLSNSSNPQPSTRKQTTLSKDMPTSPIRFRYPSSPHKESSSKFWDKQDHYSWIDQNTPQKPTTSKTFPTSTPAQINKAKKSFLQTREQLALDLVRDIDEKVMGGQLSASTSTTGGVKLEWSTRLRTAAGRAHWSRMKSSPLGKTEQTEEQHNLKIELSTKIITSEGPSAFNPANNRKIARHTSPRTMSLCALGNRQGSSIPPWKTIQRMVPSSPSSPGLLTDVLGAPKSHTTSPTSWSLQNIPTKSSTSIRLLAQTHSVVLILDDRGNSI